MNAKKAKALRKVLKNLQASGNQMPEISYSENEQNRKRIAVEDFNEAGELVQKVIPIASGTITVERNSIRGLYLHLKKSLKAQEAAK